MRAITFWCCVAALFAHPVPAAAEGLIYQLPADGSWVRYEMEISLTPGAAAWGPANSLTLSSVGVKEVAGERCRWIEITRETRLKEKTTSSTWRLLIPESQLGFGKEPLKHVKEAWMNFAVAGAPQQIPDPTGKGAVGLKTVVGQYLHGPYAQTEKLPIAAVEGKLGKLECAGSKSTETAKGNDDPLNFKEGYTRTETYTVRLHRSAPFGVVAYDVELLQEGSGKKLGPITHRLKVVALGADAKSALTDLDRPAPAGISADALYEQIKKAYADCKTYRDSGTYLLVQGEGEKKRTVEQTFTLALVRPDRLRIEMYNKEKGVRRVYWQNGKELKSFGSLAGGGEQTPQSQQAAISEARGLFVASAVSPLALLFPADATPAAATETLTSLRRLDDAPLDKVACHKLQAQAFPGNVVTLWIDAKTFLVRRIDCVPARPSKYMPETTIVCQPVVNGEITAAELDFTGLSDASLHGSWSLDIAKVGNVFGQFRYGFLPRGEFTYAYYGRQLRKDQPAELLFEGKGTWKRDEQSGAVALDYSVTNKKSGAVEKKQETLKVNRFTAKNDDELSINGQPFVREK